MNEFKNCPLKSCLNFLIISLFLLLPANNNVDNSAADNSTVVSQTGRQSSHSYRGSQWSLNELAIPQPATPIQEEGSIHSVINEEASDVSKYSRDEREGEREMRKRERYVFL